MANFVTKIECQVATRSWWVEEWGLWLKTEEVSSENPMLVPLMIHMKKCYMKAKSLTLGLACLYCSELLLPTLMTA